MTKYNNPPGSPDCIFNGRIVFSQQDLADVCRKFAPTLNVPEGYDAARWMFAFAGKESRFGADCRPRHEAGYCTGNYSQHTDVVQAYKRWGHIAHCSLGAWQLMYVNDHSNPNPELFGTLEFACIRTIAFFNSEIFGHQQARTLKQAAYAYNHGHWRGEIVDGDGYAETVQHFYDTAIMPPAIDIQANAVNDAQDLYSVFNDAIESLGGGMHFSPFAGVPLEIEVAGKVLNMTGSTIDTVSDEMGKHLQRIRITAG